jgi:23S rRNA (uracil1939-C5)-methyltransferase
MAAQTEVTISHLGPQGDGIGQTPRGRIYVEGALPGDIVRVRTWRGDDDLTRGDITQVLKPSSQRREAPCKHYHECGGCTLQHVKPDFYRDWKQTTVYEALKKVNLHARRWEEPIFIEGGTRRRATFAALKKNDRIIMGYYKRRSEFIADIEDCLVADPAIIKMRDTLKPLLVKILTDGRSTDIFLQYVGGSFDMVITGRVGKKGVPDLPLREALADLARKAGIARIGWSARARDAIDVMIERDTPTAYFGLLKVGLPPAAFLQPTHSGEQALVDSVMSLLPNKKGHFADLFSGCGTFSGAMLARGSVDAFESVETAVKALTKARGTYPLKTFKRDLFKNPLRRDELNKYDAVVFDPPRAGAREQMQTLATAKVPLLIGVSCNPATFARDARILCDGGYKLDTMRVVDQFTWSHHVEIVASFTRR